MSPHYVYVLESKTSNRTYVGYSNDPHKRLRKHNGEITGGAKYTRVGRPWEIVCYIGGFPDKTSALQFEWRYHHPLKKWGRKYSGIYNRLHVLNKILLMDNFTSKAISRWNMRFFIVWINKNILNYWETMK